MSCKPSAVIKVNLQKNSKDTFRVLFHHVQKDMHCYLGKVLNKLPMQHDKQLTADVNNKKSPKGHKGYWIQSPVYATLPSFGCFWLLFYHPVIFL